MTILIVSGNTDPHARCVQWALRQHGVACDIVELTSLPCKAQISFSPNATLAETLSFNPTKELNLPGQHGIDLSQVRAIWMRRVLVTAQHFDFSDVHEDDLLNVQQELAAFIPSIWYTLESQLGQDVQWLNGFTASRAAQNKLLQLHIAQTVGFALPATLISNTPAQIREFCQRHGGQIIVKSFKPKKWQMADGLRILPTTLIRSSDLQNDASLQLCPAIYQNYIAKAFELRVLVLGERLIAVKLDSQAHAHSQVDWRADADHGKMRAEPYDLSEEIAAKIRRFMQAIQLKMGSIDLIVTPQGETVFLEVNEQGQFLFLEDMCPQIPVLAEVCSFISKAADIAIDAAWPTYAEFTQSPVWTELVQAHRKNRQEQGRTPATPLAEIADVAKN